MIYMPSRAITIYTQTEKCQNAVCMDKLVGPKIPGGLEIPVVQEIPSGFSGSVFTALRERVYRSNSPIFALMLFLMMTNINLILK